MARKFGCCKLTRMEVVFLALLLLMTAVSVTLITLLAIHKDSEPNEEVPEEPTLENQFLIGVGRADCTGPAADVPLMGYATPSQVAGGIHTRLFCRAFIVDDGSKRVVFVSADIGMVSQRLRLEVLRALKEKYADLYRPDNVVLSGTHTHSGPAGYFQYTVFVITSKGYIKSSIQALVNGIMESIDVAHRNLKPGRIFVNKGQVEKSNFNRSPHSYMNNPEDERNRYDTNTDEQVVTLKFTDLEGTGIGALSWFAVHPVSMNYTNVMLSSDNLGYASYLFEQEKNVGYMPGEGPFVAAFATANSGDASPNVRGPYCVNSGKKCDYLNSSCPVGGSSMCVAFGPGDDMFESTRIIGENIYMKAKELYGSAQQELHGSVHAAHQWVNMTDITVQFNSTHTAKTCKPALGHSFAAGTIDGGGGLNFTQGSVDGDPFWDAIRDALLSPPSKEIQACQEPKPILFQTGELSWPVPWHPDIVDVQIITIGSVAIVAAPGEVTTMSGRRIREAVKQELVANSVFANPEVIVSGLCNTYTHYITTFEEYQVQRYEGASTIYGPHTLSAYIKQYRGLAKAIAEGKTGELEKGPEPPFFSEDLLISLIFPPPVDKTPDNTTFGDVLEQVSPYYAVGEVASVTFVAGNPRNSGDIRDKTFVTVERFHNETSTWVVVHTDASWETRFHWIKGSGGQSNATIEWYIPESAETGVYRIRHFGHYKKFENLNFTITAYEGTSDDFNVTKTLYSF